MGVYHGNDLRSITGGKKGRHIKVKRKALMGRFPTLTLPGEKDEIRHIRVRGGGYKLRVRRAATANVYIPSKKEVKHVRILRVLDNPSSRDFARRGIITKGAIIQTELGRARVTSRPGQHGVVNAVLLEE